MSPAAARFFCIKHLPLKHTNVASPTLLCPSDVRETLGTGKDTTRRTFYVNNDAYVNEPIHHLHRDKPHIVAHIFSGYFFAQKFIYIFAFYKKPRRESKTKKINVIRVNV